MFRVTKFKFQLIFFRVQCLFKPHSIDIISIETMKRVKTKRAITYSF